MNFVLILLILIVLVILAVFLFWRLYFLRQPKRKIPKKGLVSPANGTLTRIIPFHQGASKEIPKGLLGKVKAITKDVAQEGNILVIMLTPLHVHYQRAPAEAKVEKIIYQKGLFRNVVVGNSNTGAFENEKNAILFSSAHGKFKVVQVAGFAARRIECYVQKGQEVKKGELIGLINLGSQVLLILPKMPLKVKPGQELIDGETVIA